MTAKRGFTLVEILVVLVIISITLSFALLAFGDFGRSRTLLHQAEQFKHQLEALEQRAQLEYVTYGVELTASGYRILRFTPPSSWAPWGATHTHLFPRGTILQLNSLTPKQHPAIILYSSGDITPFTLSFGLPKKPHLIDVTGLSDGTLSFKRNLTP